MYFSQFFFFFLVKFSSQYREVNFSLARNRIKVGPTLLASALLYTGPVKKNEIDWISNHEPGPRCIPLVWSDIKKYPRLLECRSSCNNCFGRVPWRSEPKKMIDLPDELLSICMHVATAKFSLNFSLVDPRPKIPFREWIVHQIMVLLKCSITFESIQLIFLQCFIAFTCYSIIVSFFRSRIKKWNNQRKRVESEKKKIYTRG